MKRSRVLFALCMCMPLAGGCARILGVRVPGSEEPMLRIGVKRITPRGSTNFTSKAGHFSIYFPTPPKVTGGSMRDRQFILNVQTFTCSRDGVMYLVMVTSMPPHSSPIYREAMLLGMKWGFVREAKAKVVSIRRIMLRETAGQELVTTMIDGRVTAHAYMYVNAKNSYQVVAASSSENFERKRKQIDTVLSSFCTTG